MPSSHAQAPMSVVVTGGSSGIGLALTKLLLQRQCHVTLIDLQTERAQALAGQTDDAELAARFKPLADTLSANEQRIIDELASVQGTPSDIGGYYLPDPHKIDAVMRPSATFNAAIASLRQ